jgi:thiosulfate/3-mercaptopyruvate sulfurtransferase
MNDRLVSSEWLSANLGNPRVRIIEASSDPHSFSVGHIPGAVKLPQSALFDVARGDVVDSTAFAALMSKLGIDRADTVVLYGSADNSAAALTMWLLTMFGHLDVRFLDGGRGAWIGDDRQTEFTVFDPPASDYPSVPRNDAPHRISRESLRAMIGKATLIDTRSAAEYTGETSVPDGHPSESTFRAGHIPTAINIPRARLHSPDGHFQSTPNLTEHFSVVDPEQPVIVYDRTAARAAETWLVLRFQLKIRDVRVYDGGWIEWGNSVGLPVVQSAKP